MNLIEIYYVSVYLYMYVAIKCSFIEEENFLERNENMKERKKKIVEKFNFS